jgi:hypothetical protein
VAKEKVTRIICDRCGREEFLTEEPEGEDTVDMVLTFMGTTYQYADLCSKCQEACKGYVASITKTKAKKEEKTPPSSSTQPPERPRS